MTELRELLRALHQAGARVVIVGGFALQLQGSSYITEDIDFVYERTRKNVERIVTALAPFRPRPRGYPANLPFRFDVQTVFSTEMLTLETTLGDVDLLGALKGVGSYREVEAASDLFEVQGFSFRVLSVDGLIAAKKAANRPKDRAGLRELRALKAKRGSSGPGT